MTASMSAAEKDQIDVVHAIHNNATTFTADPSTIKGRRSPPRRLMRSESAPIDAVLVGAGPGEHDLGRSKAQAEALAGADDGSGIQGTLFVERIDSAAARLARMASVCVWSAFGNLSSAAGTAIAMSAVPWKLSGIQ